MEWMSNKTKHRGAATLKVRNCYQLLGVQSMTMTSFALGGGRPAVRLDKWEKRRMYWTEEFRVWLNCKEKSALSRAGHGVVGVGPQSRVEDRETGNSRRRLDWRPKVGGQKAHRPILMGWRQHLPESETKRGVASSTPGRNLGQTFHISLYLPQLNRKLL